MPHEIALTSPVRLAALHNSGLLGPGTEDRLDTFTRLAAQLLNVPTVLISLVDAERQYFKSVSSASESYPVGWHPLNLTYCREVVGTARSLVTADAWKFPASTTLRFTTLDSSSAS